METSQHIIEVLSRAIDMHINANAEIAVTISIDPHETLIIKDDDLCSLHPQMARTFRDNIKHANTKKIRSRGAILPHQISLLIDLVRQGPLRLQSIYGPEEHFFSKIMNMIEVENDVFMIDGMKLSLDPQNSHASPIYVVRHKTRYTLEVSGEYLDKHFSHWRQLWNTGLGIGLEDEQLMSFIFRSVVTEPKECLRLPTNITFD